jgi:heme/copper-type cytochrome/quinol oxidase subunit 3
MYSAFSLPQCVGYVAFVFGVAAFLQKNDRRLIVMNGAECVVYALHFLLLGNLPAASSNFVSVIRNVLSQKYRNGYSILFLIAVIIGLAFVTVRSPTGLITVVATIISIVAMFKLQGIPFRMCMLVCTGLWIVNNYLCHSIGGMMLETTILMANSFTMSRMYVAAREAAA